MEVYYFVWHDKGSKEPPQHKTTNRVADGTEACTVRRIIAHRTEIEVGTSVMAKIKTQKLKRASA